MSALAPDLAPAAGCSDEEVDHLYCCNPNVSLCGLDISDDVELPPETYDAEKACLMCDDLAELPCRPGCES